MKSLLSYGGGVNSTALLIWLHRSEPDLFKDLSIVFADTGGELPEVYASIAKFEDWLKAREQRIIYVKKDGLNLEEHSLNESIVPMRVWKWCTDKWKIRPINAWADERLGRPRQHILGIASDESHRAKPNPISGIENRFPLVEQGITRQGCLNLIADAKIDWVVPKSGCFFCPLMPTDAFMALKNSHPDLYERAQAMEIKAGHPLKHKFLKDIEEYRDGKKKYATPDLFQTECDSGNCFV